MTTLSDIARSPNGFRMMMAAIEGVTDKAVLATPLHFQVGPLNEHTLGISSDHSDFTTVADGEYSQRPSGRSLERVTIDTLTIDWRAPWLVEPSADPLHIDNQLKAIARRHTPVELFVTSDRIETHMKATLRNVSRTSRSGEADTLYWTLEIVEWRDTRVSRRAHRNLKLPRRHKLKAGDTLRSLALRYYGSYTFWRSIAKANGLSRWGGDTPIVNSKKFKVGSKVQIPKVAGA